MTSFLFRGHKSHINLAIFFKEKVYPKVCVISGSNFVDTLLEVDASHICPSWWRNLRSREVNATFTWRLLWWNKIFYIAWPYCFDIMISTQASNQNHKISKESKLRLCIHWKHNLAWILTALLNNTIKTRWSSHTENPIPSKPEIGNDIMKMSIYLKHPFLVMYLANWSVIWQVISEKGCFPKIAMFIWQLFLLIRNDVIKAVIYVSLLSHMTYLPSFSLIG